MVFFLYALRRVKKMGNIISAFATGVFIYVTDMVLKLFIVGTGIRELLKFFLQGLLTYWFVMALGDLENQPSTN